MRVKSRYRNAPAGGAATPIADEIAPVPGVISQRHSELADVPGTGAAAHTAPVSADEASNDATLAFQQQILALNRSERLQRDRELAAPPPPTTRTPTRDFFQPPTARRSDSSHLYSAPVSREVPDSTYHTERQGRITLTAPQKEAAKIAGCSEVVYAAQLGELERRKKDGYYEN